MQGEIRSRLLKAGCPAFVPETALGFDDAVRLVLALDGIPAYPTLADGAQPVCPFEASPEELATELKARGLHLAELIPGRNEPGTVDAYVAAFRAAGIVVTAGTEHNTPERIPFAPACKGGRPLSPAARAAFFEGACVVAAHQQRRHAGLGGFVDADGIPAPGSRTTTRASAGSHRSVPGRSRAKGASHEPDDRPARERTTPSSGS